MKSINPDNKITAEAAKALADWALKQTTPRPPLSIIAACDRVLWWSSQYILPQPEEKHTTIVKYSWGDLFKWLIGRVFSFRHLPERIRLCLGCECHYASPFGWVVSADCKWHD